MLLLALVLASQPAVFERLRSPSATSSTYLKSNWNKYEENYHPTYVLDDNPKTAWTEGADGDGVGEWLELPLSTLKTAAAVKIVIMNGYQKSKNLLEANAAPKKVTVLILGVNGEETGRASWALERKMGPQSIEVPVKGGVSAVRLVIDEVHLGKTYKDLCISDVQVFVDSDVPYNAKAEDARRKQARAWIKERVDTAKYFAKLPKEFPWVGTRFRGAPEPLGSGETGELSSVGELLAADHASLKGMTASDRDELARIVAWRKGDKPAGATLMRTESTGPAARVPEGIEIDIAASYLSLGDIVLTEAVAGSRGRARPATYEGEALEYVSDALVTKRSDGTVENLRFTTTQTEDGRVTVTTRTDWVLTYDGQGALTTASSLHSSEVDGSQNGAEVFNIFRFTRDATSKISEVKRVQGLEHYKANKGSYAVTSSLLKAEPTS